MAHILATFESEGSCERLGVPYFSKRLPPLPEAGDIFLFDRGDGHARSYIRAGEYDGVKGSWNQSNRVETRIELAPPLEHRVLLKWQLSRRVEGEYRQSAKPRQKRGGLARTEVALVNASFEHGDTLPCTVLMHFTNAAVATAADLLPPHPSIRIPIATVMRPDALPTTAVKRPRVEQPIAIAEIHVADAICAVVFDNAEEAFDVSLEYLCDETLGVDDIEPLTTQEVETLMQETT